MSKSKIDKKKTENKKPTNQCRTSSPSDNERTRMAGEGCANPPFNTSVDAMCQAIHEGDAGLSALRGVLRMIIGIAYFFSCARFFDTTRSTISYNIEENIPVTRCYPSHGTSQSITSSTQRNGHLAVKYCARHRPSYGYGIVYH